jgi:hypothetical protein
LVFEYSKVKNRANLQFLKVGSILLPEKELKKLSHI